MDTNLIHVIISSWKSQKAGQNIIASGDWVELKKSVSENVITLENGARKIRKNLEKPEKDTIKKILEKLEPKLKSINAPIEKNIWLRSEGALLKEILVLLLSSMKICFPVKMGVARYVKGNHRNIGSRSITTIELVKFVDFFVLPVIAVWDIWKNQIGRSGRVRTSLVMVSN